MQKEKLQPRKRNVCVRQTSFSAIFLSNKIIAMIFHIIHIRNKTFNPCISGDLKRRHKIEEGPGKRLHKVWTGWKKVGGNASVQINWALIVFTHWFFDIMKFQTYYAIDNCKEFFRCLKVPWFLKFLLKTCV